MHLQLCSHTGTSRLTSNTSTAACSCSSRLTSASAASSKAHCMQPLNSSLRPACAPRAAADAMLQRCQPTCSAALRCCPSQHLSTARRSCRRRTTHQATHRDAPSSQCRTPRIAAAADAESEAAHGALHRPVKGGMASASGRLEHVLHAEAAPAGSSRRGMLGVGASVAMLVLNPPGSQATNMPQAMDNAWEAIGGGPADLYFPEQFLGRWDVQSTLVKVDTPLGPDFVPNPRVVERAKREDLNQPLGYQAEFIRNGKGRIVIDRAFNTARLMEVYMGRLQQQRIAWNPDDPNLLSLSLPGGMSIKTRVTRRSADQVASDRLDTSEYFQQVMQAAESPQPRIKASQCFTKYKWRSDDTALLSGGPAIIATQVVSDYLTPDDGEQLLLRAQGKPVVVYTYRMVFNRAPVNLVAGQSVQDQGAAL